MAVYTDATCYADWIDQALTGACLPHQPRHVAPGVAKRYWALDWELPADPLGRDLGGTIEHVHIDRAGGIRTPVTFAGADQPRPAPAHAGPLIATVEAALYGVSADRTALLLALAAAQDPFPVPIGYLVSVTHADNR